MSKDRSLADFASGDESDDASESNESNEANEANEASVDPATPTYRFAPDGATCDDCGEAVQKRWHDDGRFVCADCKDW